MQNKSDPVQLTYVDFKAAASQTPASWASVCTQQPETPGTAGASDSSPGCPGSPVPWLRELWGRLGSRMAAACRAQTWPEAAPAMSVYPGPQAQLLLSVPETPSPSSGGPPPSAVGGRGPRHGHRPLLPAVRPDAGSWEQATSRRPRRLSPRNARTGRVMGISVDQTASRPLLSRLLLDSILTHLLGPGRVPGPRRGQGGPEERAFFRLQGGSPGWAPRLPTPDALRPTHTS